MFIITFLPFGEKLSGKFYTPYDEEILTRTEALMKQGASGIVYGRPVIQHENPAAMTKALMGIVHDNLTATEAMKFLS